MPYETLPGVQLQLPQYHFPETHIAPRPNIWPGIIQGIAQLAKTAEDLSPQEQEKKTLENLELRYKTNVFQKQLANMNSDGLRKPDGTLYSPSELQEMELRGLTIEGLKKKLNPAPNNGLDPAYFGQPTPAPATNAGDGKVSSLFDPIPQFIPDTTPEDYHSALNNDEVLAA